MNNEFESYEYDTALDALIDFINYMPKETVKVINYEKYKSMMQSAVMLKELLSENIDAGQIDIDICDMFNMGSIKAEISELSVSSVQKFIAIINLADNFEVYPLINGNIQLNITFQSVLKSI